MVYYGPAYAGKTTSLRYLSLRLETDVKELPTTDDRSVFFEYTQSQKLAVKNLDVKFLFWTLPGQQKYRRTRHLVLAATDAVVFVADSQYEAASSNLEMLHDLEEILSDRGMCLEGRANLALQHIPIVFFYNKRDLTDIMPVQYMDMIFGLQSWQAPRFSGEAATGKNVVQAANVAAALALKKLEAKIYGPENQAVIARRSSNFSSPGKSRTPASMRRVSVMDHYILVFLSFSGWAAFRLFHVLQGQLPPGRWRHYRRARSNGLMQEFFLSRRAK